MLTQDADVELRAAWHGDTLAGLQYAKGDVLDRRFRLVRRSAPGVAERDYQLWTMAASDSQYAVTEDTLVFMPTRDGARLATYVARPVGDGPFGVVMQRSPYRRVLHAAGQWWAARGYIFVAQHVRGRDQSSGDVADFGDYSSDIKDGYDAVEWAARLPGANGKVGLIGHSDEGRLAWYAAVSAPPHLAAIAPSAATSDPWRIVPYSEMVFGPINVDWACLMRDRTMDAHTAELDIGEAITHLPISTLPQRLGCGDVPLWDRWVAHPTLDAYWRARAVTTFIDKVNVPALSMAGWHDDSRGPLDYTNALLRVAQPPRLAPRDGRGGAQGSRLRRRRFRSAGALRLSRSPAALVRPLPARQGQRRRPPGARGHLRAGGQQLASGARVAARAGAGDGVVSLVRRARADQRRRRRARHAPATLAAADTFTYDPADPTPYLIDSRELEESLNEDYTQLNATRRDALVFTSAPLTRPLEVTGEMTATLWAESDARDTDWTVMLLDVFPDGHAERVQDGIARARFRKGMDREVMLVPGTTERYDLDLWFTSKVFQPGHRLRVSVASALFPKYDRNLNTGGNNERDSTFVVAHQRVLHDAEHPSHVTLPVIAR